MGKRKDFMLEKMAHIIPQNEETCYKGIQVKSNAEPYLYTA